MLQLVLWRNKSRWQIMGASLGVFIGLLLLLFAMQVYFDVQILVRGARDNNLLVLNKKVESILDKGEFSEAEIADLRQQSFFTDVGIFESNRYSVYAAMPQLKMETYLFFQAIPKHFLDVDTTKFTWKGEADKVPVILSADYLTLYNFGFGASQGLPKITVDLLTAFDFDVELSGGGKKKVLKAKIVGLTRNVNSILVPPEFMEYANLEFGRNKDIKTNQVIVSTDNPYNRKLEEYLNTHKLEISRGGLIGGELKSALYLLVALVLLIGGIIIGLSLLVFILNFQLLIAQSSADIRLLIELGYLDKRITGHLSKRLIVIFIFIALFVFGILYPLKYMLTGTLVEQGYELSLYVNPIVLATGIGFCLFFVWVNYLVIKRSVRKLA